MVSRVSLPLGWTLDPKDQERLLTNLNQLEWTQCHDCAVVTGLKPPGPTCTERGTTHLQLQTPEGTKCALCAANLETTHNPPIPPYPKTPQEAKTLAREMTRRLQEKTEATKSRFRIVLGSGETVYKKPRNRKR